MIENKGLETWVNVSSGFSNYSSGIDDRAIRSVVNLEIGNKIIGEI